jgi:hypothetical protein
LSRRSSYLKAAALGAALVGLAACQEPPPSRLLDGPAQLLSQTGLFADTAGHTVAEGNRQFKPSYELWSDGAEKKRWLRLPQGGVIDASDMDHWRFPVGTVVWKEFSFLGKRVETRMLEKLDDGVGPEAWAVSTFYWDNDETEAQRVNHGLRDVAPTAFGTSHDIPSVADSECLTCHDAGGDMLLGVSAVQLGGAGEGLRLSDLLREGRLSQPPAAEPHIPGNAEAQAVYGALHANCGHCHSASSPGNGAYDTGLFLDVPASVSTEAELPVWQTAVNTERIIPGSPEDSTVFTRSQTRDGGATQMPPLATEAADPVFAEALRRWISGL